jgi:hypothetical protein
MEEFWKKSKRRSKRDVIETSMCGLFGLAGRAQGATAVRLLLWNIVGPFYGIATNKSDKTP